VTPARTAAVVAVLLAALVQLPLVDRSFVPLDEGQLVAIGARLANGELLYRDVYTALFPGTYWLAELVFRLLGPDALWLRLVQLVANASIAGTLYLLARRLGCGGFAWLPAVAWPLVVVLSFPGLTMPSYSMLSLAAALVSLVTTLRYVERGRTLDGIATGAFLAASVLFKQNFGALALISVFASIAAAMGDGKLAGRSLFRAWLVPALSGLVVAFAAVVRLWRSGALPAFLEATKPAYYVRHLGWYDQPLPPVFDAHPAELGLFLFLYAPAALFGPMLRGEPWATPAMLSALVRVFYGLAYVALVLAAVQLAYALRRPGREAAARKVALPFALLFWLGLYPTAIWSHLAAVLPPLLLPLAIAAARSFEMLRQRSARLSAGAGWAAGAAAALTVVVTFFGAFALRAEYRTPFGVRGATLRVPEADASLYGEADRFLRSCAAPEERVFVLPDLPLLYVTTGRRNPTPFDLVIPGEVSEATIIGRLQSSRVRCAVRSRRSSLQFPEFSSLFPELDAWLTDRFEVSETVRSGDVEWQLLRLREEHRSAAESLGPLSSDSFRGVAPGHAPRSAPLRRAAVLQKTSS
jgi:hypothetical protein